MTNKILTLIFVLFVVDASHAATVKMISCESNGQRVSECTENNMESCGIEKYEKSSKNRTRLLKLVEEQSEFEVYERFKGNWIVWGEAESPVHYERKILEDSGFVRIIFENSDASHLIDLWVDFLNPQMGREQRIKFGKQAGFHMIRTDYKCEELH